MILNESNLYETRTLAYIPFWHTQWFIYCAVGGVTIIMILIIGYIIKRRRSNLPPHNVLNPLEYALGQMHVLVKKNKVTVACQKEFYSSISHILKRFIRYNYCLPIESYTDYELVSYLEKFSFNAQHIVIIKELLQDTSAIKFAQDYIINQSKIEHHYEQCVALIKDMSCKKNDTDLNTSKKI